MKTIDLKGEGIVLKKTDLDFESKGVLNPACIKTGNTIHMFYRAMSMDDISSIGYCQLKDNKKINYEKLNKLLKSLSGKADFVIIDSAEGMNENAINSIKLGDEILVVSTPELPAVSHT